MLVTRFIYSFIPTLPTLSHFETMWEYILLLQYFRAEKMGTTLSLIKNNGAKNVYMKHLNFANAESFFATK